MRPLAVLGLALLAVPLGAAPVPKEKSEKPLYPLALGNKWVYVIGKAQAMTVEVMAAEPKDTPTAFTLTTSVNGKVTASETIEKRDGGYYRAKIGDTEVIPPLKMLTAAPRRGDRWDIASTTGGQAITGTVGVCDREEVQTPAGKFSSALVVQMDSVNAGTPTNCRYWYVPGTGVVKLEYTIAGNTVTLLLKSFTPGK